jgi:hypothetical protein
LTRRACLERPQVKRLSHINWSPPYPSRTHSPLPLPGRGLAVVADEANAEHCAKGTCHTFVVDVRAADNPMPISTLPTPTDRDYCAQGVFGLHNLHENRPGTFQSEEIIFATYNNAGVRVLGEASVPPPQSSPAGEGEGAGQLQ